MGVSVIVGDGSGVGVELGLGVGLGVDEGGPAVEGEGVTVGVELAVMILSVLGSSGSQNTWILLIGFPS